MNPPILSVSDHPFSTKRALQSEYRAADDAIDILGPSAWVKRKCKVSSKCIGTEWGAGTFEIFDKGAVHTDPPPLPPTLILTNPPTDPPSLPITAAHVSFDVKPYETLLPNCSWHIMATPVSFPTTLPEWSCIYQSSVLRNLTSTRHAKITGACAAQFMWVGTG